MDRNYGIIRYSLKCQRYTKDIAPVKNVGYLHKEMLNLAENKDLYLTLRGQNKKRLVFCFYLIKSSTKIISFHLFFGKNHQINNQQKRRI